MRARLSIVALSVALGTTVALGSACQSHRESGESSGGGTRDDGPSPAAKDDRVPALAGDAVGPQAAFMDDALVYASVEAGPLHALLRALPLTPDEREDIDALGRELGVSLLAEDTLAQLGVSPDARLSLSVRPITTHVDDLRTALEKAGPVIAELAGGSLDEGPTPRHDSEQGEEGERALSAEGRALLDQYEALGFHLRLHLPTTQATRLEPLWSLMARELPSKPGWTAACKQLATANTTKLCVGSASVVLVAREVPGGVQLDAVANFENASGEPATASRQATVAAALAQPGSAGRDEAATMRGLANVLIDGPQMVALMRAEAISRGFDSLDWGGAESIERNLERDAAIAAMHDTERLFDGAVVEVQVDGDDWVAEGRWLPVVPDVPGMNGSAIETAFALTDIDAEVPTLASLCAGAVVCGRSRGLPDRRRFAEFATKLYATPTALAETYDDHADEASLILAVETWPNAIGTTALLPGNELAGPERFVAQNAIGVVERVLGLGFSVHSLRFDEQGEFTGEWVGYARMQAADLSALNGFLQLADARVSATDVAGVEGRVESVRIPDRDVDGNYYAVFDPQVSTGHWGWAALADGDERLRWLLEQPRDDGGKPLIYIEAPDLWRAIESDPEARAELAGYQSWLSGRSLRIQASRVDDAPRLRVSLTKRTD